VCESDVYGLMIFFLCPLVANLVDVEVELYVVILSGFRNNPACKVLDRMNFLYVGNRSIRQHRRTTIKHLADR
jgi:translation initiation factor IF-3